VGASTAKRPKPLLSGESAVLRLRCAVCDAHGICGNRYFRGEDACMALPADLLDAMEASLASSCGVPDDFFDGAYQMIWKEINEEHWTRFVYEKEAKDGRPSVCTIDADDELSDMTTSSVVSTTDSHAHGVVGDASAARTPLGDETAAEGRVQERGLFLKFTDIFKGWAKGDKSDDSRPKSKKRASPAMPLYVSARTHIPACTHTCARIIALTHTQRMKPCDGQVLKGA
jgi:hypothetical protein